MERGTSQVQFASELGGGHALGEAPQEQQDHRRLFVGASEDGPRKRRETATAPGPGGVRMTAIPHDGLAFATVNPEGVRSAATGTAKALRMEQRHELVVTGLLIHQSGKRKIHPASPPERKAPDYPNRYESARANTIKKT